MLVDLEVMKDVYHKYMTIDEDDSPDSGIALRSIQQEHKAGRITGPQYADVYLGLIQAIVQQSVQAGIKEQELAVAKEAAAIDNAYKVAQAKDTFAIDIAKNVGKDGTYNLNYMDDTNTTHNKKNTLLDAQAVQAGASSTLQIAQAADTYGISGKVLTSGASTVTVKASTNTTHKAKNDLLKAQKGQADTSAGLNAAQARDVYGLDATYNGTTISLTNATGDTTHNKKNTLLAAQATQADANSQTQLAQAMDLYGMTNTKFTTSSGGSVTLSNGNNTTHAAKIAVAKIEKNAMVAKVIDTHGIEICESGNFAVQNDQYLLHTQNVLKAQREALLTKAKIRREYAYEVDNADITDKASTSLSKNSMPKSKFEAEMLQARTDADISLGTVNGFRSDIKFKSFKSLYEMMFALANAGVIDSSDEDANKNEGAVKGIYDRLLLSMLSLINAAVQDHDPQAKTIKLTGISES